MWVSRKLTLVPRGDFAHASREAPAGDNFVDTNSSRRIMMYSIKPPKVYVDATLERDPRSTRRAEQMLKAMGSPPVEVITDAAVPDIV